MGYSKDAERNDNAHIQTLSSRPIVAARIVNDESIAT